ncbi:MAG: hypothetical protein SGJ20_16940 [Planctomycetota bacterium]|nr:hypothetical protein [Planctomycetota bacterium]
MPAAKFCRRLLYCIACAVLLTYGVGGCSDSSAVHTPPDFALVELPKPDEITQRIDAVLDFTVNNRRMRSDRHAAWQVVHGILAFGDQLPIENNGEIVPALDWLLQGGTLRGWDFQPGEKGLIAKMAPGSKEGQGHPDQWLGYLSQTGLGLDEELIVRGKTYHIRDLLEQAKWDVQPNMEGTWTLMAFATYLPLDATWVNKDGETWSIERLLAMEAAHQLPLENNACGGSHRLFAQALAVNRYLAEKNVTPDQLTGGWKAANERLQQAKQRIREFQQKDGTFSVQYFIRPGTSAKIDERISTTGHQFEVMATCMTQKELQQPWVTKACEQLLNMLEGTKEIDLEIGGLYHTAHGLKIYRQRMAQNLGPQNAAATEAEPPQANTAK